MHTHKHTHTLDNSDAQVDPELAGLASSAELTRKYCSISSKLLITYWNIACNSPSYKYNCDCYILQYILKIKSLTIYSIRSPYISVACSVCSRITGHVIQSQPPVHPEQVFSVNKKCSHKNFYFLFFLFFLTKVENYFETRLKVNFCLGSWAVLSLSSPVHLRSVVWFNNSPYQSVHGCCCCCRYDKSV